MSIGPDQQQVAPFVFSNGRKMHTKFTKTYRPQFTHSPETIAANMAEIEALGLNDDG